MTTSPLEQIVALLSKSENPLILTHARADGDGLSACLALTLALEKLGRRATIANAEAVGYVYKFLPGVDRVATTIPGAHDLMLTVPLAGRMPVLTQRIEDGKLIVSLQSDGRAFAADEVVFGIGKADYDLIVTFDTPDLPMLGRLFETNPELFYDTPVVNIDHHASNTGYGRVNLVDVTAASTTEILLRILRAFEQSATTPLVDADIATLLLTGLITDTGSFQHSNTTPRSFEIAAELIEAGARQQEIINHIFKTKQLATLKLWGRVLSKIEYDETHRLVWSTVTSRDLIDCGGTDADIGDVIDEVMTNAPGAEIVLLLKQNGVGAVGSLRTTTPAVSANEIAGLFGGGGHLQAAGFKCRDKTVETVIDEVIAKIRVYQANRLNLIPAEIVVDAQQSLAPTVAPVSLAELTKKITEAADASTH